MTGDGRLHICGSCHKGLGADHLFKVMTSAGDHLRPYEVGGAARDNAEASSRCWTGALERRGLSTREMLADCGIEEARDDSFWRFDDAPRNSTNTRYLSSVDVTKTAVASIHSFCVSADGSLFAWGCGSVKLFASRLRDPACLLIAMFKSRNLEQILLFSMTGLTEDWDWRSSSAPRAIPRGS